MRIASLPRFTHAPRLYAAWLSAAVALVTFALSILPTTPLSALDGFSEATATAAELVGADGFLVVWPAEQAQALSHIPAHIRAADAVPQDARRYSRLAVVAPRGTPLPPELASAPTELRRIGDVDIHLFRFDAAAR